MAGKADSAKLCLAFKYCVDQVRKHDLEHYIGALYMPAEHRPTQFALRAFNVETSLIPDRAREQRLAVIRLAWWRDALTRLFQGQPPEDHPVLVALAAVKEARGIRKHWLHRVIAARMEDVERSAFPPNTIADVEQYAESTSSALLYLSMQAAGIHSVQADHAASHIGKAEGMALLLRGASYHAAQRRTHIPLDVAAKHGLVHEELFRGRQPPSFRECVYDVACVAQAHLQKAKALQSSLPPIAQQLLLPSAVGADLFLQNLQRHHFDAMDPSLLRGVWGVTPLWLHSNLLWRSFRKSSL
ncbi:hypothetical protein CLOM_g12617 [Closterium sp. NIES-68]|nr:hypothetical protein CLOM_g12617 [Closterium sp. NIES-68]